MREVEIRTDVTEAVGLGEPLETVATVFLPDQLDPARVVCFGFPGGGYNRRYFSIDVYEPESGGQAAWHTENGWIFVACDYLNAGESSHASDQGALTYEHLVAANHATVTNVLTELASGAVADSPTVIDPFTIGIGQSLGGALVVLQQGQRATFDAIGILGFSARHTLLWMPRDKQSGGRTYVPRGTNVVTLTPEVHHAAIPEMAAGPDGLPLAASGFHYDDVPREIVAADMIDYPTRRGEMPAWGSATMPPCSMTMMSPGALSPEAAVIRRPVFIGVGERDTCPEPLAEPTAYREATDVTVFICPRMAHMHNFATTRELMWKRLHLWGDAAAHEAVDSPLDRMLNANHSL